MGREPDRSLDNTDRALLTLGDGAAPATLVERGRISDRPSVGAPGTRDFGTGNGQTGQP